ncbi:hypothetical protein D3C84_1149600 [compost metagenome]
MSLSEYMMLLQPGRRAVHFAALGAMATLTTSGILKMDEIRADIAEYEVNGRKIPPIAEILRG